MLGNVTGSQYTAEGTSGFTPRAEHEQGTLA